MKQQMVTVNANRMSEPQRKTKEGLLRPYSVALPFYSKAILSLTLGKLYNAIAKVGHSGSTALLFHAGTFQTVPIPNYFDFAKLVVSYFRFDQYFLEGNNKNFGVKTQLHLMKSYKHLNKVEV